MKYLDEWWFDEDDREWNRCLLVNPLCPNDICLLKRGHPGSTEHKHWLGTSGDLDAVSDIMYLADDETFSSDEELINAGAWMSRYLWPSEFQELD